MLDIGWEQYKLTASDHTLHQHVLVLRKALKTCGLEVEIIKTIPRKGLLIPESIKIVMAESERAIQTRAPVDSVSVIKSRNGNKSFLFGRINKIIFTIFMLIVVFISIYMELPDQYITTYDKLSTYNGCQIYVDSRRSSVNIFNEFLSSHGLQCENNESIYFAESQYVPIASVFKCKNKFTLFGRNDCISLYYMDTPHE